VPPDAGVELVVTLKPYCIWGIPNAPIAMHGQPTDLDAHVPLLFWGAGVSRGEYGTRVRTVDIAPTLARLLDLTPAEPLDGRPLTEVLPRARNSPPIRSGTRRRPRMSNVPPIASHTS